MSALLLVTTTVFLLAAAGATQAEGFDGLTNYERLIATAHSDTAQQLNNGNHHLNIHTFQLPPSNSPGVCTKHFKCWSGVVEEKVFHSTQLFQKQPRSMVDLIVRVQQHNTYVYAGCNESLTLLPPTFLQQTDEIFYIVPRSTLDLCGKRLQISARKIPKWVTIHHHSRSISIQLVVDLHSEPKSVYGGEFVTRFHEILQNGKIRQENSINKSKNSTSPPIVLAPAEDLKNEEPEIRKRRSVTPSSCGIVLTLLSSADLRTFIQTQSGHQLVYASSQSPFYHCAGSCSAIQVFPPQSDSTNSAPLTEQQSHDDYWLTYSKLRSLNIVESGPTASCIGYQHQVFSILYMTPGNVMKQEYIHYPTRCLCV